MKICLALLGLIMMSLFTLLGLTGTGGKDKVRDRESGVIRHFQVISIFWK